MRHQGPRREKCCFKCSAIACANFTGTAFPVWRYFCPRDGPAKQNPGGKVWIHSELLNRQTAQLIRVAMRGCLRMLPHIAGEGGGRLVPCGTVIPVVDAALHRFKDHAGNQSIATASSFQRRPPASPHGRRSFACARMHGPQILRAGDQASRPGVALIAVVAP
jgi:hypothetical protein